MWTFSKIEIVHSVLVLWIMRQVEKCTPQWNVRLNPLKKVWPRKEVAFVSRWHSREAHHDARCDSNSSTAVGIWHDVAEAHAQEGDGDQPHGVKQIRVFLIMKPGSHGMRGALTSVHYSDVQKTVSKHGLCVCIFLE